MSDIATGAATRRPHVIDADEIAVRLALHHLVAAYCHAIDRRDYALLATLYHDDAIDDHSPYYCGPAAGYIAWLPSMLANWRATSHRVDTGFYVIDGDQAEGEVRATAWHRTSDGKRDFIAHGRYADRYTRENGIWRFQRRAFILDWSEDRAVETGDDFGSEGVAVGCAGEEDPVYRLLPLMGADRTSS